MPGYGGYSPHQSNHSSYYGSETGSGEVSLNYNHAKRKRKSIEGFPGLFFLAWTAVVLICVVGYYEYIRLPATEKNLGEGFSSELHRDSKHSKKEMRELRQKYDQTMKQLDEVTAARAEVQDLARHFEDMAQEERHNALGWKGTAGALEEELATLRGYVQESSRRQLILKYVFL